MFIDHAAPAFNARHEFVSQRYALEFLGEADQFGDKIVTRHLSRLLTAFVLFPIPRLKTRLRGAYIRFGVVLDPDRWCSLLTCKDM